MAAIVCANRKSQPVDMWTTQVRCPHAHRLNNNRSKTRAEKKEKCVTHVVGQKCYPCRRLHTRSEAGWGLRSASSMRIEIMLTAIGLDDEPVFATDEVYDIAIARRLAPECNPCFLHERR